MVERSELRISIARQCSLLGIHKSGLYYKPKGESPLNLELMELMDKHYLEYPFKGARRMHTWLTEDMGYQVGQNRIERLYYKVMCLRSLLPGPHTSKRNKSHQVYPYLLRGMNIDRVNQVWQIDITYIPMKKGFMYLCAIIDVYSRYIVGWSMSNSMDAEWCTEVMEQTVGVHGAPEIINTDQGAQFTSDSFTGYVSKLYATKLSMDGKGRATDNAYIERFWRSLKYEYLYLNPSGDPYEVYQGIDQYIKYYNEDLRNRVIANKTPLEVYSKAA